MKPRRKFFISTTLLGAHLWGKSLKEEPFVAQFQELETLLCSVQVHLSPMKVPKVRFTLFLYETMTHPSFSPQRKAFILQGAILLASQTNIPFSQLTFQEKEALLRAYETTSLGGHWLSLMLTLTLEALLSDPVYGVNVDACYWQMLSTQGGEPHPKQRYLGDV